LLYFDAVGRAHKFFNLGFSLLVILDIPKSNHKQLKTHIIPSPYSPTTVSPSPTPSSLSIHVSIIDPIRISCFFLATDFTNHSTNVLIPSLSLGSNFFLFSSIIAFAKKF